MVLGGWNIKLSFNEKENRNTLTGTMGPGKCFVQSTNARYVFGILISLF
jgi:hypothetical protein